MKDRILFWLDIGIEHFGIAKFLQEKYDCDLFAIVDINKGKKFYLEQQLVKFQKIWFYRDCLSKTNKKPDLKYLSCLEERYKINLWKVAYSDILFFRYNNYYKFKHDEILSIFEQECRFIENVLDEVKPDFLIMRMTDSSNIQLLHLIAKARGIKILTLGVTRFGYRDIITEENDILDDSVESVETDSNYENKTIEELQEYVKGYAKQQGKFRNKYRASKMQWFKASLQYFSVFSKRNRTYYAYSGKTIFRIIIKEFSFLLRTKSRKFFIDKHSIRQIKEGIPFVYFPLQLEPERTVLIPAPFYTNQLEVIANIAKSLPVDYKLYVKEHPMQTIRGWREISYYKNIINLPNVSLIHPSVSTEEIIKKCSLVITITGTGGLEAALYEKPSIVLADVNYSSLPSVYRLKNYEELPQAIRFSLQKKVNLLDINKFVNLIHRNSFEFDRSGLVTDICDRFYFGGFLFDTDISIPKVKSFLEEKKNIFEQLAQEHIKKIRQYKAHKL